MADTSNSSLLAPAIALVVAAAGAVLGAVFQWIFDRRIARQRNAFDLHKELHSREMLTARTGAWDLLREHPGLTFSEIRVTGLHTTSASSLWQVMQLFHRIAAAWKLDFIEKGLVFELFGELLIWWYIVIFKDGLSKSEWRAAQVIEELYAALKLEADNNPEMHQIWEHWHGLAEQDAKQGGIHLSTPEKAVTTRLLSE